MSRHYDEAIGKEVKILAFPLSLFSDNDSFQYSEEEGNGRTILITCIIVLPFNKQKSKNGEGSLVGLKCLSLSPSPFLLFHVC
jgi:hypothetical protein